MAFHVDVSGFDDVVRRLGDDAGFQELLARDPRAALDVYGLDVDELTALARLVEPATARLDADAQRRSRAGFFALLSVASRERRAAK